MRLIVPSASLIAVFTASQTFLSSNVAVIAVDSAYYVNADHQDINSFGAPEECFFAKRSYLRDNAVDVGILQGCSDSGYVCVEDSTSSLGGLCIHDEMAERELQTTCIKCTPASACDGLTEMFIANNIGEGSCCGEKSCQGITGNTKIGANSCVGFKNCYKLKDATIGNHSCLYDKITGGDGNIGFACAYLQGTVGNNSCQEYGACFQSESNYETFNIGNDSCHGQSSCMYASKTIISNESCIGYYTCYKNKGNIGSASCIGNESCKGNTASIGDCKCIGDNDCLYNTSDKLGSACTQGPTKRPITSAPVTSPPTKKPVTAPPTKKPAFNPTKAPASPAPTKKPVVAPTKAPVTAAPTNVPITLTPVTLPPTRSTTLKPSSGKTGKEPPAPKTDKGPKVDKRDL